MKVLDCPGSRNLKTTEAEIQDYHLRSLAPSSSLPKIKSRKNRSRCYRFLLWFSQLLMKARERQNRVSSPVCVVSNRELAI